MRSPWLMMHLIAYNLVRLLMVHADAMRPAGQSGRLPFKGTLDRITQWQSSLWNSPSHKQAMERFAELLQWIAADVVHPRPGRSEPRALKRRRDSYPLLNKPRAVMRLLPEPQNRKAKLS